MESSVALAEADQPSSPAPPKHEPSIKTEHHPSPHAQSPTSSHVDPNTDEDTAKAIALAQNEYSTRRAAKKPVIDKLSTPESEIKASPAPDETKPDDDSTRTVPATAPNKKRPAPKSARAAPNGIKKPPPKKRKLESQNSEDRATPATNRSGTPASTTVSSRGGKSNTAKNGSRKPSLAGTPHSSSPPPAGSPVAASSVAGSEAEEDDDGIYCICRRGDNHTWMIACDGGCDDWYHGKCVNMVKEDQDLIDKYICPVCVEAGRGVTTWKPMCRRDGCRRPARLRKGAHSKYCCDECGVRFMQVKTQAARASAAGITKAGKGDRLEDLGPLGGAIRAHELKTLVLAANDAEVFRRLGDSQYLSPPPYNPTRSPELTQHPPPTTTPNLSTANLSTDKVTADTSTTDPTVLRFAEISAQKSRLRARRALLKDRDRFVTLVKERAMRLATAAKIRPGDFCGYDARLGCADAEFREWRESKEGIAAFTNGSLDGEDDGDGVESEEMDDDDDTEAKRALKPRLQPQHSDTADTSTGLGSGQGESSVCTRRRCQRHTQWQKVALHDVRFEEAETRAEMRRVDDEERELRERMHGSMGQDGGGNAGHIVEVVREDDGVNGEAMKVDGVADDAEVDTVGDVNGVDDRPGLGLGIEAGGTVEVVG